MDWQPIETAPKDGQVVLVYDPTAGATTNEHNGSIVCPAAWVDREFLRWENRGWFRSRRPVTTREQAWECAVPRRDLFRWITIANNAALAPSHWMPLPKPPK